MFEALAHSLEWRRALTACLPSTCFLTRRSFTFCVFLSQGMSCPVNTHKPSFHVNTSVASRHGAARPAPDRGGGAAAAGVEQTMTEEEFFEWLQSAVQSGAFDGPIDSDGPSPARPGAGAGSASGSKSNPKKKKKGKKQW